MQQKMCTLAAILFLMLPALAGAEDRAETGPSSGPDKNYLAAASGALLSNAALFSVNRFIGDTDFSRVSIDTIRHNLTSDWQWDQSKFQTNQIGHPYQGSTYFVAGRANGLNFYESTLVASFGSVSWELFCERCDPGMNDLIVTTLGGASLGEMFHRLYAEASGKPLAFLVSPMDAVNEGITRRKSGGPTGAISAMSVSAGLGYTGACRHRDGEKSGDGTVRTPSGSVAFDLAYGDPFSTESTVPFEQFDLRATAAGGCPWYAVSFFSDGYLASWRTADAETHAATAGITLHYDFIWTRNIQFSGNALDFTVKSRRNVAPGLTFSQKLHAGWLTIASANFYPNTADGDSSGDDTMRDYGTGVHAKLAFSLAHEKYGSLDLGTVLYGMWILPGTVADSEGSVLCQQVSAVYSYPLSGKVALELGDTFMWEKGRYDDVQDVEKRTNEIKLGARASLK